MFAEAETSRRALPVEARDRDEAAMSKEDEIRALKEELEQLRGEAARAQFTASLSANNERQREIIARLADLGVQLG